MFGTWWERSGLTKEQAEQVLEVAYKLNVAGLGNHIDSLISIIIQFAPSPHIMDSFVNYDKDKIRNRVNEQIRCDWSNH